MRCSDSFRRNAGTNGRTQPHGLLFLPPVISVYTTLYLFFLQSQDICYFLSAFSFFSQSYNFLLIILHFLFRHGFAPYVSILLHRGRFVCCPFLLVQFKGRRRLSFLIRLQHAAEHQEQQHERGQNEQRNQGKAHLDGTLA